MSISVKPHRELEGKGAEVEVLQAVSTVTERIYRHRFLQGRKEMKEKWVKWKKKPKPKPIRALGSQGNCFCGWSPSSVQRVQLELAPRTAVMFGPSRERASPGMLNGQENSGLAVCTLLRTLQLSAAIPGEGDR